MAISLTDKGSFWFFFSFPVHSNTWGYAITGNDRGWSFHARKAKYTPHYPKQNTEIYLPYKGSKFWVFIRRFLHSNNS